MCIICCFLYCVNVYKSGRLKFGDFYKTILSIRGGKNVHNQILFSIFPVPAAVPGLVTDIVHTGMVLGFATVLQQSEPPVQRCLRTTAS